MSCRFVRTYLRRARKRANQTQKGLTSNLSISLRTYVSIEGGQSDPTSDELEQIAIVLGENVWETQRSENEYLRDRRRFHRQHKQARTGKTAG